MRVAKITVARLKSTAPYENERLEVDVELAEGDSAAEAVKRARTFIAKQMDLDEEEDKPDREEVKEARRILRAVGEIPHDQGAEF